MQLTMLQTVKEQLLTQIKLKFQRLVLVPLPLALQQLITATAMQRQVQ